MMGEEYNMNHWEPASEEEKQKIYSKLTISDRDHWHTCNLAYEYHGELSPQDIWDNQVEQLNLEQIIHESNEEADRTALNLALQMSQD